MRDEEIVAPKIAASVTPKKVGEHNVLYVMATEAEFGPALKRRTTPLMCHVGPVEAAMRVSAYLAINPNVDLVVSLGSAGSATLEQAHVYQVSHVSYRDMDASPLGFEKGVTPFLDLPAEIDLPFTIPNIPAARLSTGGGIVSGDHYANVDSDMVDMETWAILRPCMHFGVPLIGLRGISDGAEPVGGYADWTRYLHVIDERLADACDALEAAVLDGSLVPAKNL